MLKELTYNALVVAVIDKKDVNVLKVKQHMVLKDFVCILPAPDFSWVECTARGNCDEFNGVEEKPDYCYFVTEELTYVVECSMNDIAELTI